MLFSRRIHQPYICTSDILFQQRPYYCFIPVTYCKCQSGPQVQWIWNIFELNASEHMGRCCCCAVFYPARRVELSLNPASPFHLMNRPRVDLIGGRLEQCCTLMVSLHFSSRSPSLSDGLRTKGSCPLHAQRMHYFPTGRGRRYSTTTNDSTG
jgi:hypothetical protein